MSPLMIVLDEPKQQIATLPLYKNLFATHIKNHWNIYEGSSFKADYSLCTGFTVLEAGHDIGISIFATTIFGCDV